MIAIFSESLPSEWAEKRLKYAAPLRIERVEATADHRDYLGLENIQSWTGKLLPTKVDESAVEDNSEGGTANRFQKDDVLFGKLRPYLAKAFHADKGGVCSTEFLVLLPQPDLHPRFLLYSLLSPEFVGLVDASTFGAKMPRANWDFIGSMSIPIPSMDVQERIANYLDRETAHIDALIAEKERMLALLEEKRAALISQAVTRGLDPTNSPGANLNAEGGPKGEGMDSPSNVPLKPSGLDWLGDIPAHWDVIQLRFACESLQTGPFGTQLHAEDYVDNGIPVINPAHLRGNEITPDYGVSVDQDTADRLAEHKLLKGDVVFARRGDLGRCGIVNGSQIGWLCGTGSLRVRCNRAMLNSMYLALLFTSTLASKQLSIESVGSTMENLNTDLLGHFRIPLPSIKEQEVIVGNIKLVIRKLQPLVDDLQSSIALAKERRSALITAAVTGQIPQEEMAA